MFVGVGSRPGLAPDQCAQRADHAQRLDLVARIELRAAAEPGHDGERACVTLKQGFEKVAGIRVREEFEPRIAPSLADTT